MPAKLTTLLIAGTTAALAGVVGYQGFTSRDDSWEFRQRDEARNSNGHSAAATDGFPESRVAGNETEEDAGTSPETLAQNTPQPAPPASQQATPPAVDESALRYFARQGDTKRLEAEIARLRALYPGWTPPENPLALPPAGDPQLDVMWQSYAQGRFADVRKAIAQRQAREPGWQPPEDLLQRLTVAETRVQLVNASNIKQYETVIRLASATPSLLTCSDIDVLWRVAEAFAQTDRRNRALEAYRYVLSSCDDVKERYATLQKAMVLLPRADIDALLELERKNDAGDAGEFSGIRDELARQSLLAAGRDAKLVVSQSDLARIEALTERDRMPADALLLGWYHLRRDAFQAAEKWFELARRQQDDSVSASQGLGLAVLGQGRPAEAENILYPHREASEELRKSYLAAAANLLAVHPPVQITSEVLQRIITTAVAVKDPLVAQLLGWYAYALNQFDTASLWFEQGLAWKADDEPSAFGLVLTRQRLGDKAGMASIQNTWKGRSARIETLGKTSMPPTAEPPDRRAADTRPLPEGVQRADGSARLAGETARPAVNLHQRSARRVCPSTIHPETLSPEDALNRGWCLMDMNRPLEAAPAFEVALRSASAAIQRDAAYGQSLAYLRAGLTDKAAVAAAKAPQDRKRSVELETALLADRALAAFEARRYVETLMALDQFDTISPMRVDLMVLRGYAYMNLRRYGDARKVFQAVAAAGNADGARGLADLREMQESRFR